MKGLYKVKQREFIVKSTFAGLALFAGLAVAAVSPLGAVKGAEAAQSFGLPEWKGEGDRWSPSLKDTPAAANPAFWLAQDGKPRTTIVVATDASDINKKAAGLLQEYVRKISGATLPIVNDSSTVDGSAVLIGRSKFTERMNLEILPDYDALKLDTEEYIIRQIGNKLVLLGNDRPSKPTYKGSLFAVSEVLQRLGCRWYFPDEFGEVIPKSRDVSLPRLDETVRPSFAVRGFSFGSRRAQKIDKKLPGKLQLFLDLSRLLPYASVLPSATDGSIMAPFRKWESREIEGKKVRFNKMFEEHPEYFAQNEDGTRDEGYLCLTNPRVLQIVKEAADHHFKENPDAIAFPLSAPDGRPVCYSEGCRKKDHYLTIKDPGKIGFPDISGSFYWFMNEVAKYIEEEHPSKLVSTLAYAGRTRPPEDLDLRKNITVRTALLGHSRNHRYDQPITWQTKERVQLYKKWAALVGLMVEREYYPPITYFSLNTPQPMYLTTVANVRFLKSIGFKGMDWESKSAYFSEGINNYIRSQLLWNVGCDANALLEDFYTRFYGKAAPIVREFDESVEKAFTQSLVDHREEERIHEMYPHAFVMKVTEKAEGVEKLVASESALMKRRAAYFKMKVDHFRAYSEMRHAESQFDFIQAAEKAREMIKIEEEVSSSISLAFIDYDLRSRDESKTYGELGANSSPYGKLRQYLAKQKMIDGTDGELVAALPETWRFKTDPLDEGVMFEWHRQADNAGWRDMKTTESWEIQGLQDGEARGYNGFAWYRTSVDIPKKFAGKEMTLFIGGMNNQAWIWVNNKLAAAIPYHEYWQRWKYHSQVDLSDYLEAGKTNHIAIRIWNEQDAGGLFRRSFIYSPKQK